MQLRRQAPMVDGLQGALLVDSLLDPVESELREALSRLVDPRDLLHSLGLLSAAYLARYLHREMKALVPLAIDLAGGDLPG